MPVVSILIGAVAAYALGVVWYMVLSGPWMKAAKLTREDIGGGSGSGMSGGMVLTYGLTFIMWLVTSFEKASLLRQGGFFHEHAPRNVGGAMGP